MAIRVPALAMVGSPTASAEETLGDLALRSGHEGIRQSEAEHGERARIVFQV